MAILFWNVFTGKWNEDANWLGEVAPAGGDTGVIGHGILTNSTVDFTGLTITGQTIDVVAANQLVFNGTTLAASTTLNSTDADGLMISVATVVTMNGPVTLEGDNSFYLIPDTTAVLINAGTMKVAGAVVVMGAGTLVNSGTIEVAPPADAPTVIADLHVPSFGIVTQNDGLITLTGAPSQPVSNTRAVFENVTGAGTVRAANAEVTFLGSVAGGTFEFADAAAVLRLNSPGEFDAAIKGFVLGNTISLGSLTADSVDYIADPGGESGILRVYNGGSPVAALSFVGTYDTSAFSLGDVGGEISLSTSVPCFAAGTMLRTARGEVAVEDIAVGDVMPTKLGGASAKVVWTGWRKVQCRRHKRPQDVMPVRVRRGAVAPGAPKRDVLLSPDHALWIDGVLVPVRYLVNGATILRHEVETVTYWHVELERHDVIEAGGLAVESYLDTGNRASFSNGPQPRTLHADFGRAVWATDGCAKLHVDGPLVAQARARLLARAREIGFATSRAGDVRVSVDGRVVEPLVDGAFWLVALPRGAKRLRLRSASGVPEAMAERGGDSRRLGVAIAAPAWDGAAAGLDDSRFLAGWHAPEEEWRWTDGDAELDVTGLADVGFTLVRMAEHWVRPARSETRRKNVLF